MRNAFWGIGGIGAGVVAAFFIVSAVLPSAEGQQVSWRPYLLNHYSVTTPEDPVSVPGVSGTLVEDSFAVADDWEVPSSRVFLIPHHGVAGQAIASLLLSVPEPRTVYVLAPDHFSQSRTPCSVTDADLVTELGTLENDVYASQHIAFDDMALERRPFETEISWGTLAPFALRAWPKATIVPMICKIGNSTGTRQRVAEQLVDALKSDRKAIFVASVDFSHELPAEVADFHDVLARDVIEGLADLETDKVELDSPDVLAIMLKVARALGLGNATIHAHTNSLRLTQSELSQESTSHYIASFSEGPIRDQDTVTMLLFGDMMFDREVRNRIARSDAPLYPFDGILGAEGRFVQGQDLIIGNLEGPITSAYRAPEKTHDFAFDPSIADLLKRVGIDVVSQANNHQLDQGREGAEESKRLLEAQGIAAVGDQVRDGADEALRLFDVRGQQLAFLAFNITDNPLDYDAATRAIEYARDKADRIVVFMHWGAEYQERPNRTQTDLAHWFIDQGVDAVVGAHPHWMQSVEVYNGHLIAYSLGNFIFDQDWSTETRQGLVVGLSLSASGSELHLFPIRINKSRPELLTGSERQTRLDRLAEISDPGLTQGIKAGIVRTGF